MPDRSRNRRVIRVLLLHMNTDSQTDFASPVRRAIIVRLYELWRHFYGVFDGGGRGKKSGKRRACCSIVTVMRGRGKSEHSITIRFLC